MAGPNTLTFTESDFETQVLASDRPVLVDFWAEWCGPCLMLAPLIDELANEYAGKLKVGKVDIDKAPQLSNQFGVQSIPTVIVFHKGVATKRLVGIRQKSEYKTVLDAALAG